MSELGGGPGPDFEAGSGNSEFMAQVPEAAETGEALPDVVEGPVFRVGAWCETAPYSGEWQYVEECVVAPSLEAAMAQSQIEPGFGNSLKGEKAFDSYWDRVDRDVKDDRNTIAGIERYREEDPVADEHLIFEGYIHFMENAKKTVAWIERFSGLEPRILREETGEPKVIQGRWEKVGMLNSALTERLDRVSGMLETPADHAEALRDNILEQIDLADRALSVISEGSPGEFRCCKDCGGPQIKRAVWQLRLLGPHDRRLDDDTFCVSHAQRHLDRYREEQKQVATDWLIGPDEPVMPGRVVPLE